MPARRASLLTATLLATAVALTGCASSTGPATESEAPETTEASSSPAPEETSDSGEVAGDATAPGTELAFGEPATVEWVVGDGEDIGQMIEITVTGVEEGAISDFEDAGLPESFTEQLVGFQPMYVQFEATKLDPSERDLGNTGMYTEFGAIDANGTSLQTVSIAGTFEPCDASSTDSEIDEGATFSSCIIVATREGQEFGGATWEARDSAYGSDGEPIVWS